MTYLPIGVQFVLLLVVLAAVARDLKSRRIPNWLTVSGFVLGLLLNSFLSGTSGLLFALQGAGMALLVYFPLFFMRAVGAGDAKLMAAIGALAGPWNWLGIFFLTAMIGGLIALLVVLTRGAFRRTLANVVFILRQLATLRAPYLERPELDAAHEGALTLPHALAIAGGAVGFLFAAWQWAPRV
jgi:prepilin peptidase CpaA